MAKINCFYSDYPGSKPKCFKTVSHENYDECVKLAAKACNESEHVNGEYHNACVEAIILRGYYGIGYSGRTVYIEDAV